MIEKAFCFDDVLLVPTYTSLKSRSDPITQTTVGKLKLDVPLISSPMDTVTDANMIIKMSELGGTGILHRFYSGLEYERELNKLREKRYSANTKTIEIKGLSFLSLLEQIKNL